MTIEIDDTCEIELNRDIQLMASNALRENG